MSDGFARVGWVKAMWASRVAPPLEEGLGPSPIVLATCLNVPQRLLSMVVESLYSRQLPCTPATLESLLYISDFLQAGLQLRDFLHDSLPCVPGAAEDADSWVQMPCVVAALLQYVAECLLPTAPALVHDLGMTLDHLLLPRQPALSLCDAATEEVLTQLAYQDTADLSVCWKPNDSAWVDAARLLQQLPATRSHKFMTQVLDRCVSGSQVSVQTAGARVPRMAPGSAGGPASASFQDSAV